MFVKFLIFIMNEFEILKEAYINGLEPKFKNVAYKMFDEGKNFEEIYRHISKLRKSDRGTIKVTRPLTKKEKVFLALLSKSLRKQAFSALMQGDDFNAVKRFVKQAQSAEKVKLLKKKTVEAALETVTEMQKCGVSVPLCYYELIFDWEILVPMDYELFGKMALLMLSTYNEQGRGAHYQEVRSFMFKKIEECFDCGIMPHPLMFDFMFKGDWISEKTFMILHVHAQELIDAGMGGKLALPLERMLEIRRKNEDPMHPFSQREEHYFISLINLFRR